MHPTFSSPVPQAIVLLFSVLLMTGCSGSSSGTGESPTRIEVDADNTNASGNGADNTDGSSVMANDGSNSGAVETGTGSASDATAGAGAEGESTDSASSEGDSAAEQGTESEATTVVPDPMVQNSTRVEFEITVPSYQSNALQVRVVWDDKDLAAAWVGDELWSVSDDFPTNTEHQLTVTFYDDNGVITLGSFEQAYRTGTNASETYSISADQFDLEQWDDDADGESNLSELIAGTYGSRSTRVLLFSETRDFRHDSTEVAVQALQELAESAGMQVELAGDSAGVFTDVNLAQYGAVVWVMTSGDVLNADEQSAFEQYIRAGGGYAGIHAASFTEYEWPWYGQLVGAYFDRHPEVQAATQDVEDSTHASTAHLSLRWTRTDEWYDYRTNPRAQVNVLLTLDEESYTGGGMGADHPSAWYHDFDGGRSWYTGGGHTEASYAEPDFRAHLLGGLRYAAGNEQP